MSQVSDLVGKTIVDTYVEYDASEDGVYGIVLVFDDGTIIKVNPTNYNFGSQNLIIDIC